jgi:hypothetical protein
MPQPTKYGIAGGRAGTDAERARAYRERKKERLETLAHELAVAKALAGSKKKRSVTVVPPGEEPKLRQGLLALSEDINRRCEENEAEREQSQWTPEITRTAEELLLLDHIENELDRLMKRTG